MWKMLCDWRRFFVVITNQERAYLYGVEQGIALGRQMADQTYGPLIERLQFLERLHHATLKRRPQHDFN